jgi:hypothetical protein
MNNATLQGIAVVLGAAAISASAVVGASMYRDNLALSAENRELRLRGAAKARVDNFKKGGVTVNMEAVANAAYDMGTPSTIIEAMRRQENGSPLWELGHKGKTATIAACVPPDHWQMYEASRTANKAIWRWAMKHHRKEAIKALGKAYTAEAHAARWARNVDKLEGAINVGND